MKMMMMQNFFSQTKKADGTTFLYGQQYARKCEVPLLSLYRGPASVSVAASGAVSLLIFKNALINLAAIFSATPITARTKSCALGWRSASVNTVNCFCVFSMSDSALEGECSSFDDDDDDDEDAFAYSWKHLLTLSLVRSKSFFCATEPLMVMGGKLLICAGNASTNGIKFGSFAISFAEVSIKASMTLIVSFSINGRKVFSPLSFSNARSSKGGKTSSALKSLFSNLL